MKKSLCLSMLIGLSIGVMAGELEIKQAMWKPRNVKVTSSGELLKAEALNQDPILSFYPGKRPDCANFCAITFELQIPATKKQQAAQVFFNTTESKGIKEAASVVINLAKDGKMHRYSVSLAGLPYWKGSLLELRLDPVADKLPFTLGKVALTDSLEVLGWYGGTIQKIEKDEVFGAFNKKTAVDPSISASIPGKGLTAKNFATVEFELAMDPGCAPGGQLFWTGNEVKLGPKNSLLFHTPADSKYHKVTLKLAAKPEWKGIINWIRLDMTHGGAAGKTYRLKNFKFIPAK